MAKYFLAHKDGWLCVVMECLDYSEPFIERIYYPVEQCREAQAAHLIGSPCKPHAMGGGLYTARVKGATVDVGASEPYQWPDYDLNLRLKDDGRTMPVAVEKEPVPCPKVRKGQETRYRYGVWQKYTAKGWVSA